MFCVKFQKDMPGLDEPPFDNHPLGQRIYENVSKEAWKMWLEQMKMIMNEYRLNLGTQEAQEFLLKQMEDYFFGEGAALPPGYVPPQAKLTRSSESNSNSRRQGGRYFKAQVLMRASQRVLHGIRSFAAREDEAQIAGAFRKRDQLLSLLRGDDHVFDAGLGAGSFEPFDIRRKFLRAEWGSS